VSRYQKGNTNLDFTEARDSEWQWHQLGHMQVCTSLQTHNHASTPSLSFLQAGCPSCRPTNSIKALKALDLTQTEPNSQTVRSKANWNSKTDQNQTEAQPIVVDSIPTSSPNMQWQRSSLYRYFQFVALILSALMCLQGFDTVGWVSERAPGL